MVVEFRNHAPDRIAAATATPYTTSPRASAANIQLSEPVNRSAAHPPTMAMKTADEAAEERPKQPSRARLRSSERRLPPSHGRCAGRLGRIPCALRQRSERKRAFSRRSASIIVGPL